VIDVRPRCGDNPDFAVPPDCIKDFEIDHGQIPGGSAVLICTGWDRFLALPERYIGGAQPGVPRCPGLSGDAMQHLVQRRAVGVGIDTLSVDPGMSTEFPAHRTGLGAGLWLLEGLVGLDRLPALGTWLVVGAIPVVDGSGAPARVLCFVPSM
jgi:kynurenine formamidase